MDEVLDPSVVRVVSGRCAVPPADVILKQFARPTRIVEERIRKDVVGLEVWVKIAQEGVSSLQAEVGLNATDCEVHMGEAPSRWVRLLTED